MEQVLAWLPSLTSLPAPTSWLAVLLSGVAGAVLTLGAQGAIAWWRKPILEMLFSEKEDGCRVTTPSAQTQDPASAAVAFIAPRVYLRLKVRNRGRTFAKNVNVCITKISLPDD